MHYIIGTRFSVIQPRPIIGKALAVPTRREKLLPAGVYYQLIYIAKVPNGFEYQFAGSDGNKHVVHFASCRDADAFIAKQLNETIPDYDSVKVGESA